MRRHTHPPALSLFILLLAGAFSAPPVLAQTLYNSGDLSADEQMYLEYINRARANPTAEGTWLAALRDSHVLSNYTFFSVNLALMQSEFAAIPSAPPLAPNGSLTNSARGHSNWMFSSGIQAHNQSSSNSPSSRATAAGYNWSTIGENIYAYADHPLAGHAGFNVDWGDEPNGMQSGRGHRVAIHSTDYREVGIGVRNGSNTVGGNSVGPQIVTQDFGRQPSNPTFGLGVAFYDLNGNNFYDLGEGISGLRVDVSGGTHYCLTAPGGGWCTPVPSAAAVRNVTFSGLGLNQTRTLSVPSSTNAKTDLRLTYAAPVISSPTSGTVRVPYSVTFGSVPGATGYTWSRHALSAVSAENAESLSSVIASTTGTYAVLDTTVKQQGASAFHLLHATGVPQTLELVTNFYGGPSPAISFQSRLRTATTAEIATLQVQVLGSSVWQDVWTQAGSGGSGETAFQARTVALPAMAGKKFRVRFNYFFSSGSFYNTQAASIGWFIDAINPSGMEALGTATTLTLSGNGNTSASFTPAATGRVLQEITPIISGLNFPSGTHIINVAPASGFTAWAATMETAWALPAGMLAASPLGDHDKDGSGNLLEYAFGSNPAVRDASTRKPTLQPSPTHLVVRYQKDTALTGLTWSPQISSNLSTWFTPGQSGAPAGFSDTLLSSAGTVETREMRILKLAGAKYAMRLRIGMN